MTASRWRDGLVVGSANPADLASAGAALRAMTPAERRDELAAVDWRRAAAEIVGSLAISLDLDPAAVALLGAIADAGARAADLQERVVDQLAARPDPRALDHLIDALLARPATAMRTRVRIVRALDVRAHAGHVTDAARLARATAQVLRTPGGDARTLLLQARVLRQLGHPEAAIRLARRACGSAPPDDADRIRLIAEVVETAVRRGRGVAVADLIEAMAHRGQTVASGEAFAAVVAAGRRTRTRLGAHAERRLGRLATVVPVLPRGWEAALDHALDGAPAAYQPSDRVLLVGNSLRCGGMERLLAASVRGLRDHGGVGEVDLALLELGDGANLHFLPATGLAAAAIIDLGREVDHVDAALALLSPSLQRRTQVLIDAIRARRPRAVHAWNDLTGVLAAFAAIATGCPRVVIHLHHLPAVPLAGMQELAEAAPALFRRLLELPAFRFAFCSAAAARGYADWWEVHHDRRFVVVHNGVPVGPAPVVRGPEARAALGLPTDGPVIGTVFGFRPVKQPLVWVDMALALLARRPELRFVLVGDGPLLPEVRRRIDAAGATARFQLPGQVEDVTAYLAAMDLFVMTSSSEGLGLTVLEAQLAGVPVIALAAGGVAEALAPGETGVLVAPGDPAALVEAVERALGDPAWCARAGAAGRPFVIERFGEDRFFARLAALYA